MPEEIKNASCPKCGEKKRWSWQGWSWRKDKDNGENIKDVHLRRCKCGTLYGVIDQDGYKKKMEEESNDESSSR